MYVPSSCLQLAFKNLNIIKFDRIAAEEEHRLSLILLNSDPCCEIQLGTYLSMVDAFMSITLGSNMGCCSSNPSPSLLLQLLVLLMLLPVLVLELLSPLISPLPLPPQPTLLLMSVCLLDEELCGEGVGNDKSDEV